MTVGDLALKRCLVAVEDERSRSKITAALEGRAASVVPLNSVELAKYKHAAGKPPSRIAAVLVSLWHLCTSLFGSLSWILTWVAYHTRFARFGQAAKGKASRRISPSSFDLVVVDPALFAHDDASVPAVHTLAEMMRTVGGLVVVVRETTEKDQRPMESRLLAAGARSVSVRSDDAEAIADRIERMVSAQRDDQQFARRRAQAGMVATHLLTFGLGVFSTAAPALIGGCLCLPWEARIMGVPGASSEHMCELIVENRSRWAPLDGVKVATVTVRHGHAEGIAPGIQIPRISAGKSASRKFRLVPGNASSAQVRASLRRFGKRDDERAAFYWPRDTMPKATGREPRISTGRPQRATPLTPPGAESATE